MQLTASFLDAALHAAYAIVPHGSFATRQRVPAGPTAEAGVEASASSAASAPLPSSEVRRRVSQLEADGIEVPKNSTFDLSGLLALSGVPVPRARNNFV